mgnify:CR=1 FL=1
MRNIIFIAPGELLIPSEKGAIEEIIWKTSLELSKLGFNVYIYNPMSKSLLSKITKGLTLSDKPNHSKDEVILHFHDMFACLSYTFKNLRIKNVVLTFHYPPWRTKNKRHFLLLVSALKYLTGRNVVMTAPSKAVVYWLKKVLDANAYLIPNGVDTTLFHPSKRSQELREKLLENKEVLISYVARIHPDKNQLDLLKAVNILVNNYGIKNIKVVFIGPIQGAFNAEIRSDIKINPYFVLLKSFIEKKRLKEYVIFLGEVPRKEEAAYILASSDIYVHTAVTEAGVPLAIMEAMASGLPIVAYDTVYYRDYLKNNENSILVKRGDVATLAHVLETLITQETIRKTLGTKARTFAEENLSWEKIVKKYYVVLYAGFQ